MFPWKSLRALIKKNDKFTSEILKETDEGLIQKLNTFCYFKNFFFTDFGKILESN